MRAGARRVLVGIVAVAALGGCSSAGSSPGARYTPSGGGGSITPSLRAKAHLAPCPASSTTPVSGGLPDVTLDCLGVGPAVHLAGLTGMPTVVNIWGSWCIPCQEEAAVMSAAYDADRGKVRFLGVDTADSVNSALDFGTHVKPPIRYPSVVDPDRRVLLGLAKSPGVPQTAFVGASGVVVHVHIGPYSSVAELRSDIATYLHVQ